MKQIFLIIFSTLSISSLLFGQEFNLNSIYADSIQNMNLNLGKELHAIILYNQVVNIFGYSDTIKITKIENIYNYYYKDFLIKDLRNRHSNKKQQVTIDYSLSPNLTFLISTTKQSLTSKFELVVLNAYFDPNDLIFQLRHFSNDVQIGKYEERTKSGKVLVTGEYCQIDSMYSDTIVYFDPNTYEEILEIIPRSKFPIKSGVWKYFTPQGILSNEENYKICSN